MVTESWSQPFRWGLLMAFDDDNDWVLPEGIGGGGVYATSTCLAVTVLHAQDVEVPDDWPDDAEIPEAQVRLTLIVDDEVPGTEPEYDGTFLCPSGRLSLGDAETSQVHQVPAGPLRLRVWREPVQYSEAVTIHVSAPG